MSLRTTPLACLVFGVAALFPQAASQQPQTVPDGEWRSYHRDQRGTRYSPLAQIDKSNVARLDTAWTWIADSTFGARREGKSENTPLMVNGTLYYTAGIDRHVVAADPATGKTKWAWYNNEGARLRVAPRYNSGRGLSYWRNAAGSERIFVVTPGFQLVALDAKTGKPVADFGNAGIVDLKLQLGVPLHVDSAGIGNTSPPIIFENIVVIGPALDVGTAPRSMRNVPGRILAIDAVTGKLVWRFNTIPQAGEPGVETWENDSWQYTGNTGAWAPLSLDERRGYLYVPVESPTGDYYGGHRNGNNLYSSALLCLDVRTGKRVWHFQTVHHDIWDYDNPTAPILVDITVDGRRIEAVAQMTKQGFTFVFDRANGAPVWPIEERPVPQSDTPGEKTSPTQPFPTKPPAFDRQGVTIDDLIDFTPELRAQAVEVVKAFRLGGLYTPPSVPDQAAGKRGTLSLPNSTGGGNWEHGAFDPETGMLYVGSVTNPTVLALAPGAPRSDMNYIGRLGGAGSIQGLPLVKPPYGRITALDLNKGELRWFVASGDTPDRIRNNPALAGLTVPRTGNNSSRPVVLATKTLLFQGEGTGGGAKLHVLDKATGAIVRDITLSGTITSSPMSYMHEGRQYVAFWISNPQATLVTMALPR